VRNKQYIRMSIAILILFSLGCGVVGSRALGPFGENDSSSSTPARARGTPPISLAYTAIPTPVPDEIIAQADAEELLLINLYERVNPSVVNLEIVIGGSSQGGILPEGPPRPDPDTPGPPEEDFGPFNPRGEGSGFVYDGEGHIVTNSHVVEGATAIFVTFFNGLELEAEIVGIDPDSDLAIIKVEAPDEVLSPVVWGDSNKVVVGQRAVAIGNPFGLPGSLTTGIISGLGRNLLSLNQRFRIPAIIQTDAAINPGNSGGPLLNSRGEVIGVNSAIVPRQVGFGERSFLGVGFAVPSNLAKRVIPSLIAQGYYDHPWIGIEVNDVTPEIAQAMGLDQAKGALVVNVLPGGPASAAGLQGGNIDFITRDGIPTQIGGDVIIMMGNEEITSFNDLIAFLSQYGEIDAPTKMIILREGQEMELEISLGARPRPDQLSRP